MGTKKKIITIIIGAEAVIIAAVTAFVFYINSDIATIKRQQELAQRCLSEEDYEQAAAAFGVILEMDPENEEASLGLAEAYAATDDLQGAVSTLEKVSRRVDSEKVLTMLEVYTADMEQREQAAQRAAEEAAAAAAAEAAPQPEDTEGQTPESEPETVLTGFIVQDDAWYYYDAAGNYVTGWFEADGGRYCAGNDGRLYRDGEYEIDGKKQQFDALGVWLGEVYKMPFNNSMDFLFSSGAGAWHTYIKLNADGTFDGYYQDANMGQTGEGYPGGTLYYCSFSGKFTNIIQINDYTYSLTLSEITIDDPIGEETIEDDILYITSGPYGMEDGTEYLLYIPETPISGLSEEFLSWWPGRWDEDVKSTLSYYGLYNIKMGYGIFEGF